MCVRQGKINQNSLTIYISLHKISWDRIDHYFVSRGHIEAVQRRQREKKYNYDECNISSMMDRSLN